MAVQLIGASLVAVGNPGDVHSTQENPIGKRMTGDNGAQYIYLKGVTGTVVGSWVTYDEAGVTALLAADAIGPVAVATAIVDSNTKYGWYAIWGSVNAKMAANCADNACIGREGSDGVAGDGRAAGDEIIGAISRAATTSAAVAAVQLFYPLVNDKTGS